MLQLTAVRRQNTNWRVPAIRLDRHQSNMLLALHPNRARILLPSWGSCQFHIEADGTRQTC